MIEELDALRSLMVDPKHSENEIAESDNRYRRLVQFLPDAVRIACNNIVVYVNDAAVRLYGARSANELIGRSVTDFIPPELRAQVSRRRNAVLKNGTVRMLEQQRLRLDGTRFDAEVSSMRITWHGKPAALTVLRDISNRVETRRILLENERRLSAMAENIPGATFECVRKGNGRIVFSFISQGIQDLFDVTADSVMARSKILLEKIDPDDLAEFRKALKRAAPTLDPIDIRLRALEGRRWIRATARPCRRDDGMIVWDGIFIDVTERHEANAQLRAAKEAAEFADRTKTEFLAHMSHEIRTPLNAIMGFSEVMENQLFGPMGSDRYREYASDIHASGGHLLSLIEDILDLSKLEAGQMEMRDDRVDIARVIQSSVAVLKRRAEDGKIRLAVKLGKGLPKLRGDERRMRQVMMNLVTNASKFTPDGGKVSILVSADDRKGLQIQVTDTGIGMRSEDIQTALTPFGQIHDRAAPHDDGTGLGLPLAKSLVERHGGRLSLKSAPGKGTKVTLSFPPLSLVA